MSKPPVTDSTAPVDPAVQGRPIGWILAGSLFAGLAVALVLAFAPFIPAEESGVTGAVLLGFALGWALFALLSARLSDQPQRWASAPAVFFSVSGLILIVLGSVAVDVLRWLWPPVLLALVVWMVSRARRQLRSRSRLCLLYPVFAILVLTAVAGGYETVSEAVEGSGHRVAGRLFDVGGHRLHLHCTGSSDPAVVLEAGGGDFSPVFGWIAPVVARNTRVCVYDRAGRGGSEAAEGRQDGARIASDLHTLLLRGGVKGPYVLAGHSFGGLYVRIFADRYPADVAGIVLIDSTAARKSSMPVASSEIMERVSALAASTARIGTGRLAGLTDYGSLPPRSRDEVRASAATAPHVGSFVEEFVQASASEVEAASLVDFGRKPLFVLTAGIGSSAEWMAAQKASAKLSTNSAQLVVAGAKHADLLLNEDYAAVTTQAILDVVSSARTGKPLAR